MTDVTHLLAAIDAGDPHAVNQLLPLVDIPQFADSPDGLIAVDEALARFAAEDSQKAELVKLRFFAGLTMPDVATALGVSVATAERWWTYAKALLFAELSDAE